MNDMFVIAQLFFWKVVHLYEVLKTITSDQNNKFPSHFYRSLGNFMIFHYSLVA
jgi:hypothetical protein